MVQDDHDDINAALLLMRIYRDEIEVYYAITLYHERIEGNENKKNINSSTSKRTGTASEQLARQRRRRR